MITQLVSIKVGLEPAQTPSLLLLLASAVRQKAEKIETGTQSGPRAQHPGPCCSVENGGRARRVEKT